MITSAANERIRQVCALIQKHKERKQSGLFTAEGIKIFSEADKKSIRQVYVSETFEQENPALLAGTEYIVVRDDVFSKMCDTKTPQGILTVLEQSRYKVEDIAQRAQHGPVILLEDVQDPGNVGTIIRTAEGAGAAGVILSTGCADLYAPKTIRSTMGSVLRVPSVYCRDLADAAGQLKSMGITLYAAHLNGKNRYDEQQYARRCAIMIGNEARGLSKAMSDTADVLVKIPMEGELDSLNAAVAASILMYTIYSKSTCRI